MRGLWINLKSSLWFVPALSVLVSAGLAVALVELDAELGLKFTRVSPQFFGLGADGSRSILATIAQSVITIAGVSFSITIVALSLAANQYTPRVLRNFMRDRGNQTVLGGLVGIFTYCIIVLRTIQGGDDSFVPPISVILALGFSIVAIGLFIYFVHHVASSIQASSIISSIAVETEAVIRQLSPEEPRQAEQNLSLPRQPLAHAIKSPKSGYLQTIEVETLSRLAEQEDVRLEIVVPVGEFVLRNTTLLKGGWSNKPDANTVARVQRCFNIEPFRTIEQDPAFGMRQIVDIAVKALSPGINDPTTAITCLEYLGSILNTLMERPMPSPCSHLPGNLTIRTPSFEFFADLAFEEIRQNCQKQPAVYRAMFRAISKTVGERVVTLDQRMALKKHAQLILQTAERTLLLQDDISALQTQARELLQTLDR
jgi:uncharacterized membrane protein